MEAEVVQPADREMIERVLSHVPQKAPFRFIDEITTLTEIRITGSYRYREDEYFYQGHFPGHPITPGVILIETMAQFAVVAMNIYLRIVAGKDPSSPALFTDCEMEFSATVPPGSLVRIFGDRIFYRRGKIKSHCRLELEDGTLAASGTISGMETQI